MVEENVKIYRMIMNLNYSVLKRALKVEFLAMIGINCLRITTEIPKKTTIHKEKPCPYIRRLANEYTFKKVLC